MRLRQAMLAAGVFGVASCGQALDTFDFGEDAGTEIVAPGPDLGAHVNVRFRPADILMFIDSSASMEDEQANLAQNFDRFVSQVAGVVDYRLAVVSMDLEEQNRLRGASISTHSSVHPNRLVGMDRSGCVESDEVPGCIIDGARGVIDSDTMDRSAQVQRFREISRVGTCGSGNESGLGAMKAALEALGDGCNAPFQLRPEANLVLIFVGDEDDQSGDLIAEYIEAVRAVKDPARVRVAIVAGVVGGAASSCGVTHRGQCGQSVCSLEVQGSRTACGGGGGANWSCPPEEACSAFTQECVTQDFLYLGQCQWCSYYNAPDCCSALAGHRYLEFAREMEMETVARNPRIPVSDCVGLGTHVACLAESICQASFGDTLARIAQELVIEEMEP